MKWSMKDARLWETRLWDDLCEKHAYERRAQERCAYERHAYGWSIGGLIGPDNHNPGVAIVTANQGSTLTSRNTGGTVEAVQPVFNRTFPRALPEAPSGASLSQYAEIGLQLDHHSLLKLAWCHAGIGLQP
jgi:hypothetical protein